MTSKILFVTISASQARNANPTICFYRNVSARAFDPVYHMTRASFNRVRSLQERGVLTFGHMTQRWIKNRDGSETANALVTFWDVNEVTNN